MQSEKIEYKCFGKKNYTEWLLNHMRHREDGPAFDNLHGVKSWWIKGYRHRIDGHAFEDSESKSKFKSMVFYLYGLNVSRDNYIAGITYYKGFLKIINYIRKV